MFFNTALQSNCTGGFVAVNAGGNIDCARCAFRTAPVTVQFAVADCGELFGFPTARRRGGVKFAKVFGDMNPFAVIAALVNSEPLHLGADLFATTSTGLRFLLV